jgi:hypothetical protein
MSSKLMTLSFLVVHWPNLIWLGFLIQTNNLTMPPAPTYSVGRSKCALLGVL